MRSKNFLKNVIAAMANNIVVILCGFIVPKLIISKFGSNVNGLINSITQFLAYITLLEAGIGPIVKAKLYKPIAKKNVNDIQNILAAAEKLFRNIVKIFLIYIIVLCFIYPFFVEGQFSKMYTIVLLIIISFSTVAEYFFGLTYSLFLQSNQKIYIISIFRIITVLLSTISIVVMINLNCNIFIVKFVSSLFLILRPIFLSIYVKKKYNLNLKNADKNFKLKDKWDGLIQHIASVIHTNTDITILTIFSTITEVSVYSIYFLVINGVKKITLSITTGIDSTFGDIIAKNESDNLNNKFDLYEIVYLFIITIVFTCTIVLITPFISVYMRDIYDANYVRPLFGYLIVISEYIYMIRIPYIDLAYAAGHFKETKKGAVIECILNIVVSIILVWKFGIIGVAIGTIIAMLIRTCEFIYHTNKFIIKRSVWLSIKKIIVLIFETSLIVVLCNILINYNYNNFGEWFLSSVYSLVIAIIVVSIINFTFFKTELLTILKKIKSTIIKI